VNWEKIDNEHVMMIVISAHPKTAQDDLHLQSIYLAYFPPNMISVFQPMDLGIIKNFKQNYRHELMLQREQIDNKLPLVDVNILQAINIQNQCENA
jgi:DDE superfamily endonuclease